VKTSLHRQRRTSKLRLCAEAGRFRSLMWRSDIFGLLGFPPFVPAADVGVADALNVDSRIWVDLTSPLNGFGLGWEYSAGPFRTWSRLSTYSSFLAMCPSLRVGYTQEHPGTTWNSEGAFCRQICLSDRPCRRVVSGLWPIHRVEPSSDSQ
jgi:hypothetical protein